MSVANARDVCGICQGTSHRRSFTQAPGNVIQNKAFVTGDGMVVVAVIGGSEEEELTAGTGIETLARRLCQRSKAVVLEDNLREASVKGSPHDGTLSRRHRGRHQDSTLTAESQSFCLLSLYLLVGETPRALYLHMERFAEEEDVALCRERHAFPRQRALHTEEVRVLTLDEEPAGGCRQDSVSSCRAGPHGGAPCRCS